MKKLLYIFAFAATIVACDKDGGLEMEDQIASIEQEANDAGVESVANLPVNFDAEALVARLQKSGVKPDTSSSKDADNDGVQDAGSYILIKTISTNDNYWEFALSEDVVADYCDPSDYTFENIYLVLQEDKSTDINYGAVDGTTVTSIAANISSLYGFTYESGYKLDFSDYTGQTVTAVENVFTFTE